MVHTPKSYILPYILFCLLSPLIQHHYALSQVRVFENGQPVLSSGDTGLHPESPTRRKIDLNGEWSYAFDGKNWSKVRVPSAFDYEGEITFLRKFTVDDETLSQRALKFVALGINYEAEVSVNDVFIGWHVGGYGSFEFEVPSRALRLGSENVVKVIVRNRLNARTTLPVRKQVWGWKNYAGMFRDVYFLSVPRTWIDGVNIRTEVGADLRSGVVRLTTTVTSGISESGHAAQVAEERLFTVRAELFDRATNAPLASSAPTSVSVGQNRVVEVQSVLNVANMRLWSPESPELYRLTVRLWDPQTDPRRPVDEMGRLIGFSRVQIENEAFVVNGSKTALRGVVWHEDSREYGSALTYEQMERDIVLMKTMGANAVRFAFHPPHPSMVDLCSRYGLWVLEEIPVWHVPAAILSEEYYQVLAETALREMVQRDRHQASVLAWGVGSEFDTSDLRARPFVQRMSTVLKSLDHRPSYYGSRMVANDRCIDLVDIAAIIPPPGDEKQFREVLEQWKARNDGAPTIVLRYRKEVEHNNRNGYSDPLSEEAQARFFELRYRIIKDVKLAGSFVDSFADWRGDRPIMTVNLGDPYLHPVGLVSDAREKRTAFDVVRALYHEEKLVSLPIGSYRASFPTAALIFGLVVLFLVAYLLHYNRRFTECFGRSLLRPYNFFADLRDLHAVDNVHTAVLAIAISIALGVTTASLLFEFRASTTADLILTQFVVSDGGKQMLIVAAWNLFAGSVFASLLYFLLLCFVAALVKLMAVAAGTRILWYHAFSVTVWGALPLVFLIVPGMILLKLLEDPSYVLPSLVVIGVVALWACTRILKGVSVVYDVAPWKAYIGGSLVGLVGLAAIVVYLDAAYALGAYLEFFVNITRSLG